MVSQRRISKLHAIARSQLETFRGVGYRLNSKPVEGSLESAS